MVVVVCVLCSGFEGFLLLNVTSSSKPRHPPLRVGPRALDVCYCFHESKLLDRVNEQAVLQDPFLLRAPFLPFSVLLLLGRVVDFLKSFGPQTNQISRRNPLLRVLLFMLEHTTCCLHVGLLPPLQREMLDGCSSTCCWTSCVSHPLFKLLDRVSPWVVCYLLPALYIVCTSQRSSRTCDSIWAAFGCNN
ncbi:hypothetical protein LR48_Vigan11g049800 [Vigna angularis]|uniref:Uncharacterized protein n=2 Tax=Phaseolus angularis TaxID=3914 RepID=A0A0L9VQY7_PHAAN|nr:hypothetical protein LR48_Vigan11g049800 [Vigna angularis]BAT97608.1 hypothetical protein VIGAN_09111000 [Vigna angularis var. angularis]